MNPPSAQMWAMQKTCPSPPTHRPGQGDSITLLTPQP